MNFTLGLKGGKGDSIKKKKKDNSLITSEQEFQRHLRQAWKQKRILELDLLAAKRKRKSKQAAYDPSYEQPRKKVKRESGGGLLQASRRKKREKKPTKKLLNQHMY